METALMPFHVISIAANLFVYFSTDFSSQDNPAVDMVTSALLMIVISQTFGLFATLYLRKKQNCKKDFKREDEELCLKRKHDENAAKHLFGGGMRILFNLIVSIFVCFIVIILLGAPLVKQQGDTLLLSLSLVFSGIVPVLLIKPPKKNRKLMSLSESETVSLWDRLLLQTPFRCEDTIENFLLINFYLVLLGAWIGAFFLKLDWNEPWKVYPLTSFVSLFAFNTVSHFFALCLSLKKLII